MRNAKQLLQEYNDFSFRDPEAAAEMFTEDGAFEIPTLKALVSQDAIEVMIRFGGSLLSCANFFLICNSFTQKLSVNLRMGTL